MENCKECEGHMILNTEESEEHDHDDIVVHAVPQIRVYINGLEELGICILTIDDEKYRVNQEMISIPLEHVKTIADAMIKVVEDYKESM
mgnify:CR=1 FL=1